MAKRKKKRSGQNPAPASTPAPKQNKSAVIWSIVAILAVLITVVVICVILATGQQSPVDEPTEPVGTGVTQPSVDNSNAVTMRIVKPGSAYVIPDTNASSVFSFRKGDRVEVVSSEGGWSTIAVEGRGYYIPTDSLRSLDEYLVVIDPGHQLYEDRGKEAIGPGGADTETRMEAGNVGVATGMQERDLNYAVCMKLKAILEDRGYKVMLTHNNNGASISNVERTQVANKLYADAYISLHTNSVEDDTVKGMFTICQTAENSYNAEMQTQNKELSTLILDAMVKSTGANKLDIQQTDKNAAINWCQVPMTVVQMGHLSNADEDRLMTTEAYQQKIAEGIANGLDQFFAEDE